MTDPAKDAADKVAAIKAGTPQALTAEVVVAQQAQMMAMLQKQLAEAQQQVADMRAFQAGKSSIVAPGKGTMKAYFSTIPMCTTHVMRAPGACEAIQFVAGMLETDDLQDQAHLDSVCDKPGTGITSQPQSGISQEEAIKRADIRQSAEKARQKMLDAGLSTV
jgi:hypothetical protein